MWALGFNFDSACDGILSIRLKLGSAEFQF